jgi:MoaA/NifB/PqqE/SkfB family radical SAM enzyme
MRNSTRQMRGTQLGYKRGLGLVQELSEMGCKKIHFSGGEPLLWDGLFTIADYAKHRKHIKVNLTTNGTLLNREMAKKSIHSRFKTISVSLDSPDESIHDSIRGTGNWRKT